MSDNDYTRYYSDESFRGKLQRVASLAGAKVVYAALLLFYMMKDPLVSVKAKVTIMAALGYFILPADAIPDVLPALGFTDDLGVLIFALSQIRSHLTEETMQKAKEKLMTWFRQIDEEEIEKINSRLV
ncbi:MAG: YkvA family protein [Mangrovibacterium sp.]